MVHQTGTTSTDYSKTHHQHPKPPKPAKQDPHPKIPDLEIIEASLWRIATTRMRCHQPTIEYTHRRQTESKTRREIIRCLKRHIAREIYHLLTNPPPTPNGALLRTQRHHTQITLTHAATALQTHPNRISQLERGLYHNLHLATQYQQWLTQQTI